MVDLASICDHLEDQIRSIAAMNSAIDEQRTAIVDQRPADLAAATSRLQTIIATRTQIDRNRERLLEDAATTMRCAVSEVTVPRLVDEFDGDPNAERLSTLSVQMRSDVERMQENHANLRVMIESEMGFAGSLLRALNPVGTSQTSSYSRSGSASTPQPVVPSSLNLEG